MLRCESLVWIILGHFNGLSNWIGLDNKQILRWLNFESIIIHISFAITLPDMQPVIIATWPYMILKINIAILIISHLESS